MLDPENFYYFERKKYIFVLFVKTVQDYVKTYFLNYPEEGYGRDKYQAVATVEFFSAWIDEVGAEDVEKVFSIFRYFFTHEKASKNADIFLQKLVKRIHASEESIFFEKEFVFLDAVHCYTKDISVEEFYKALFTSETRESERI